MVIKQQIVGVTINGCEISEPLHVSVSSTNCFSADTYSLTLAIGAAPPYDLEFWSSIPSAYVEVRGEGSFDTNPLITGAADVISVDPIKGLVSIEGRDRSSSLIDSYRLQSFVNQSASSIVSTIAGQHGLSGSIAATNTPVGRYYGDGHTRLSTGLASKVRSDWDVVVQLARESSFDAYVIGQTLFFQPPADLSSTPYYLSPKGLMRLRIERSLAPQNNAIVQSWNSQTFAAYQGATSQGHETSTPDVSQPYLFSATNFTPEQVDRAAQQYGSELSRLNTVLHAEMPWDLMLTPRTDLFLTEISDALDGFYKVDSVERHFSSSSGSIQLVRAHRN